MYKNESYCTCICLFSVPTPNLKLSFHEATPTTVYVGHNVTALLNLSFTPYLNTNVTIRTVWRLNGIELDSESLRMSLLPMREVSGGLYESGLVLMNVSSEDEGHYECQAVTVSEYTGVTIPMSNNASFNLNIRGKEKERDKILFS